MTKSFKGLLTVLALFALYLGVTGIMESYGRAARRKVDLPMEDLAFGGGMIVVGLVLGWLALRK